MVKAQEFSDDPVVMAQAFLDRNTIIHSFNPTKNYAEVVEFLNKKQFEEGSATIFINFEIGENQIDVPVQFVKNQTDIEFNKSLETAKNGLLGTLKSAKENAEAKAELKKQETENPQQGGIDYNLSEASDLVKVSDIDSAVKTQLTSVKISKISYIVKNNVEEVSAIEKVKTSKKISSEDRKVIRKKITTLLASSEVVKPTEEYKKKVLVEAQTTKEGIAKKQKEVAFGKENQKFKDQKVKESQKQQKQKAKEIKKLIKEGKKDQIKVSDIYELGEESQKMGLEIKIPDIKPEESEMGKIENQPKVKLDETKALNYQEEKQELSFLDKILNFGSVKAEAFYPQYNDSYIYYAKPNTHTGTVLDLYGGNQNNGAEIGFWYKNNNNSWNQKFDLYQDSTFRVGGKCLDLNGNNAFNYAKLQLWDCNGSNAQKWVYDSEGLLRLRNNTNYCVDANGGEAGSKIFLYTCGSISFTESLRAGEYVMRIFSRRLGTVSPVGHTLVGFARFNSYNWIDCYTTYTLWNAQDNSSGIGCNDNTSRGWWDNVLTNRQDDYNEGIQYIQNNYNPSGLSYWQKSITSYEYASAVINGGWQPPISTYSAIAVGNNCTTFSTWLWNKYTGWTLNAAEPTTLYYALKNTQVYYQ